MTEPHIQLPPSTAPELPAPLKPLLLRRQFFLGDALCADFVTPRHAMVAGHWQLTHQHELGCTQARWGRCSVTLLGFALDPTEPAATDQDLAARLLAHLAQGKPAGELIAATHGWGGRWAVVADDGREALLWQDATGLRPVCYTTPDLHPGTPAVLCASDPGLIARALGLQPDPEALAYVASRGHSDYEVDWMPGDTTLYAEVRALLPNHHLELRSGRCVRHAPTAAAEPIAAATAIATAVPLLRGLLDAAARRAPLSISMTAGWDSRLMLALCRPLGTGLHAFTLTYPHLDADSRDVRVPAQLLARLGITHHVYRYPLEVDADFKAVLRYNATSAASGYCADAQALSSQYPQDHLCVTGDVAEIVKCHYRLPGRSDDSITATDLAGLLKLAPHPFLLRALDAWLADARPSAIPLLDLMCWEQMVGRWQATIRADYDIVQDNFAPLNCHHLLMTLLAVDPKERGGPGYPMFRALIHRLWPDTLAVPINPRERQSLKTHVINAIGSTGVLGLVPRGAKTWLKGRLG